MARRGQLEDSKLRPGWTTGACATAAATAAYQALLTGEFPDPVEVDLPQGRRPSFALTLDDLADGVAMAAVTKDAGDDPDVTHGALVRAWVRPGPPGSGLRFLGGPGVGTVTLPGLPLAVGEPAINPAPRAMIAANLSAVAQRHGAGPLDLEVTIGVDDGQSIARHTWNPRIGILGGISILGTTGVVVPYSCSAWIDSIRRGIDVARAAGLQHLAACTGSTSERVVAELYGLPELALLDMGDFAGAVLKYLSRHPVDRLTICGGFAKLTKLAAGHLDLHSHRTQVDLPHLAVLAMQAGADERLSASIRGANTAAQALDLAAAAGIRLGDAVATAARDQATAILRGAPVAVDVLCIDRGGAIVGRSD
ncbi:cobalt-precorrin-5B (C(1))-methyltransferase [Tessaracoccus sp. G1721]